MAVYKITPTTSRFSAINNAFADDSPGPDTLIVDAGAFLVAPNHFGAGLAETGAWTVTVNGWIFGGGALGINLPSGNTAISTITIGAQGLVSGGSAGIAAASPATIKNAGTIVGTDNGVIIYKDTTLTNSGTITGTTWSVADFGASTQKITNSGTLSGSVDLKNGNDSLTNSGVIFGDVFLGEDADKFGNSGALVGGVDGGEGNDTFSNFIGTKSGSLTGAITLGEGNDRFFGGSQGETVVDGPGADTYNLGGGSDLYLAVSKSFPDVVDTINGGAGVDTYNAGTATSAFFINLDTVVHNIPFFGNAAPSTAGGDDVAGSSGKDTVIGFENAVGGAGADNIAGNAAANVLDGGDGTDRLFGFGGNDTLIGGNNSDVLAGGLGADTLTGGGGNDFFQLRSAKDSGVTKATRDVITDFNPAQGDYIDIDLIDANPATPGDDDFSFFGTNVTSGFSAPSELHAIWVLGGQMIEGDINGDKKADFSIFVVDPTHALSFSLSDFFQA